MLQYHHGQAAELAPADGCTLPPVCAAEQTSQAVPGDVAAADSERMGLYFQLVVSVLQPGPGKAEPAAVQSRLFAS